MCSSHVKLFLVFQGVSKVFWQSRPCYFIFIKKKKKKEERKNKNKPVRLPHLSENTDPDLHQRRRQATSESGFAISIFLPSLTSVSLPWSSLGRTTFKVSRNWGNNMKLKWLEGFPLWCSGLRIWCCPWGGMDSVPVPVPAQWVKDPSLLQLWRRS